MSSSTAHVNETVEWSRKSGKGTYYPSVQVRDSQGVREGEGLRGNGPTLGLHLPGTDVYLDFPGQCSSPDRLE